MALIVSNCKKRAYFVYLWRSHSFRLTGKSGMSAIVPVGLSTASRASNFALFRVGLLLLCRTKPLKKSWTLQWNPRSKHCLTIKNSSLFAFCLDLVKFQHWSSQMQKPTIFICMLNIIEHESVANHASSLWPKRIEKAILWTILITPPKN